MIEPRTTVGHTGNFAEKYELSFRELNMEKKSLIRGFFPDLKQAVRSALGHSLSLIPMAVSSGTTAAFSGGRVFEGLIMIRTHFFTPILQG